MAHDEQLQRAREIIGPSQDSDWRIDPTVHAEHYAKEAPALAAILRSDAVVATAAQYKRRDAEALEAQARFKWYSNLANVMVLLAGIAAAGVLVANQFWPKEGWVLKAFGAVAGVCGCVAAYALTVVKGRGGATPWMSLRSEAETARLEYFTLATAKPATAAAGLTLLQLEYYLRFLYYSQMHYFTTAGARNGRGSINTLRIRGVGAGLATLGAAVGGFAGGPWVALAAVGVAGAAISAFGETREGVYQNTRNEQSYGRTLRILEALEKQLRPVREASAAGERGPMDAFVKTVNDTLAAEHKTWREAESAANAAVAGLEKALKSKKK